MNRIVLSKNIVVIVLACRTNGSSNVGILRIGHLGLESIESMAVLFINLESSASPFGHELWLEVPREHWLVSHRNWSRCHGTWRFKKNSARRSCDKILNRIFVEWFSQVHTLSREIISQDHNLDLGEHSNRVDFVQIFLAMNQRIVWIPRLGLDTIQVRLSRQKHDIYITYEQFANKINSNNSRSIEAML